MKLAPPRPLDGPLPGPAPKRGDAAVTPALLGEATISRPGRADRAPRDPRSVRRVLRGLAVLFGVVGALALVDGVLTLVWQEPISGLLAHISQSQLAKSLTALDHQRPTAADEEALNGLPTDEQRMAYFARNLELTAQPAQAVGRIVIPRIGADYVVVAGTSAASLRKGPGIYSGTSVPGLPGTVGIAGHRTTYLAPFRRINELAKGDLVTLDMPYGSFTYTVTGHRIVAPNNISVLRPTGYDQVVLTACNPLYSASQRLAVFARLTSSVPTGLALGTSVPQTQAGVTPVTPTMSAAPFAQALIGTTPPADQAPLAATGSLGSGSRADALIVTSKPTVASGSVGAGRGRTQPAASSSTSTSSATPVNTTPPSSTTPPVTVTPTVHPVTPTSPASSSPAKPVAKTPTTPAADTPTAPDTSGSQSGSQTRVQGAPGGPGPIIGSSG